MKNSTKLLFMAIGLVGIGATNGPMFAIEVLSWTVYCMTAISFIAISFK